MNSDEARILGRIALEKDFSDVIERLADVFGIGKPTAHSFIPCGFEDCNVIIEAGGKKYIAKMFSKERDQATVDRLVTIMTKVVEAGVQHPRLIESSTGGFLHQDGILCMVLMEWIQGKTFFELDRVPNSGELASIIEQAAKINQIDYHPTTLYDSWAIPNIKEMFTEVRGFLGAQDLLLVEEVMSRFEKISVTELPHAFVHGDFTKANVIKGDDGKIYILDFSVANWYPRIQEIAVVSANLLYSKNGNQSLQKRVDSCSHLYQRWNPLTEFEKSSLYVYALAAVVMEFMGSHREKYVKANISPEVDYWMGLGRLQLRDELAS